MGPKSSSDMAKVALVVLMVASVGSRIGYSYETYAVEDSCGNGSLVLHPSASGSGSSAILVATEKISYSRSMECDIRLVAPSGYRLLASIREIDFRVDFDGSCLDYLKIEFPMCEGIYRLDEDLHFESKDKRPDSMSMEYYTHSGGDDSVFNGYHGFVLTYTVFQIESSAEPCGAHNGSLERYRCDNGRCIWSGLKCDGHNNCGDFSDEWTYGAANCSSGKGSTVLVILGVLILALMLIMCATTLLCTKNEKVRRFSMRLRARTLSVLPRFPGRR